MLACLFAGCPASAQLAPGSDGRLLDANNQVGSGGQNLAAPRNLFNTSNLFVTGNTTRGTAFQGFSPIRNQSSLFSTLPSSVLANFERDSVGLDAISGVTGYSGTNPYFNRTQTVTNAGAILDGRNLIGSSVPANSVFAPRSYESLSNPGISGFEPANGQYNINPSMPTSSLPGTSPLTQYPSYTESLDRLRSVSETEILQANPLLPNQGRSSPSLRFELGETNPYSNPYANDANSITRDTDLLTRQRRSTNDNLRRPNSEEMLATSRELISPTAVAPRLFQPATSLQSRDPLTGRVLPDPSNFLAVREDTGLIGSSTLVTPTGTGSLTTGAPGSLSSLDPAALQGAAVNFDGYDLQEYTPESIAAASMLLETANRTDEEGATDDGAAAGEERFERAQSVIERATTESLSTLAGSRETTSADAIIRAEKEVQEGQYYQAAQLYELASKLDPENAMPRLGHAHALFAAGEYMTAYQKLVRAIELYPAFGYLNFDLTNFIPDVNLIDIRRADLEKRLARQEDYRLRFLLGYVENYIGLKQFALPNLRRAAGEAPKGSIVAQFPDILQKPSASIKKSESSERP